MITRSNPARLFSFLGLAAALATGALTSVSVANAQASFAILHSFTGSPTDGDAPYAGLIQAPDRTLYGTTFFGGSSSCLPFSCGTVFQMAPDGSGYTVVHRFTGTDGSNPYAGLIQGLDGPLYGVAQRGGTFNMGTIFQMAPDGSGYTVLHSFTLADGYNPYAGLIQGPDGTLYGTTFFGGTSDCNPPYGCGTVFQMAPDGSGFTVMHNFTGGVTDGAYPSAGLIQGPDGTLYGTTGNGGTGCGFFGCGTVFKLASDGSGYTVLHSFTGSPTDGANPNAGLIQGPDGTLFGTTQYGATNDRGMVFQMAPDGSGYTVLHSFTGTDGANPLAGLFQGPDGTLYGTTYHGGSSDLGTVFQMAPDGSGYTVLHSFAGRPTDGANPQAGLMQGPDGTLYGTSFNGGTSGFGVVFQLTLPSSAPTSGWVGHN